jgi:hypothetical protein
MPDVFERLAVAQATGAATVGVGLIPPSCQHSPNRDAGTSDLPVTAVQQISHVIKRRRL